MKTVHVIAWEYTNGCDAGGGGFDWFQNPALADAAFRAAVREPNWAYFRFDVAVSAKTGEAITREIDRELIDLCASAARRIIGADVATYWRTNNFKMGPTETRV